MKKQVTIHKPNDVILGRGGYTYRHHGNEAFRHLAMSYAPRYMHASRTEKSNISKEMVNTVQELTPPGRFLKRVGTDDYVEVDYDVAREKASQCLRDAASICMKNDSSSGFHHHQIHGYNHKEATGSKLDTTCFPTLNNNNMVPFQPFQSTNNDTKYVHPNYNSFSHQPFTPPQQTGYQDDHQRTHLSCHASYPQNLSYAPPTNQFTSSSTSHNQIRHPCQLLQEVLSHNNASKQTDWNINDTNHIITGAAIHNQHTQQVSSNPTPSSQIQIFHREEKNWMKQNKEKHIITHVNLDATTESLSSPATKIENKKRSAFRSKSSDEISRKIAIDDNSNHTSPQSRSRDFDLFHCRSTSHSVDSIDSFDQSL